jgi:hypothetical protein
MPLPLPPRVDQRAWVAPCALAAVRALFLVGMLSGPAFADEPGSQQVPLRPFVSCVESLPDSRLRANWGYLNTTRKVQVRDVGSANRLIGTPEGAQPKTFEPGLVTGAFSSVFDVAQSSTWSLDGVEATADRSSHRCSPAERSVRAEELVNPAPGKSMFLGANFWNLEWQGATEYLSDEKSFAAGRNPWLPKFLADLAPYHVLRFMDWNLTNDASNSQSSWSTRSVKERALHQPIAYEWQIDLCNRTLKDYWVNVPHMAGPAYFAQLAQLIREQLDPRLRVYVEWSNEVWNGIFPQHDHARARAEQLGLSGSDPRMAYQVHQSVRLFEAFAQVFGADNPRVIKVLAGQAAYDGPCRAQLAALADAKINPKHTRPDVYAIAPYVHGRSVAELRGAGLTRATSWITDARMCADSAHLPLIAYEGGQDSFGLGVEACQQLQRNPGMRALYSALPDAMAAAGLRGPFMHYTHSGACWGLKVHTSDSAGASPKYQGLLDWSRRTTTSSKSERSK